MKFDFLGIRKTLESARSEVATLRDRLQAVRTRTAQVQQQPVAKAEIRAAFERWLDEARTAAVAQTIERTAQLSGASASNRTAPILVHRILQVDERGRAVLDTQMLVALLGEQLLQMFEEAVANPEIPEGVTAGACSAELERLTSEATRIRQQIEDLEKQATESGVEL